MQTYKPLCTQNFTSQLVRSRYLLYILIWCHSLYLPVLSGHTEKHCDIRHLNDRVQVVARNGPIAFEFNRDKQDTEDRAGYIVCYKAESEFNI